MEDNYLLFRMVPTMRCNYRCSYCFLAHEEKAVRSTAFDLHPPEEWIRAMENFSDSRVEFYFWGGEPFVIDGTYDLVKGWVGYDHVISGSRIDTNMAFADKIAQRCPTDKVKLNCSWHTQYHTYDQIFRKVKLLNDVGMVGMLNFVASPANLEVLRNQYGMTLDELIARFDEIGVFVNIAADFALVNGPRKSGYDEYKRMILQYTNPDDWRQLRAENGPSLCQANQHFFTIQPNGDLTPCIGGEVCGNFFEGTLRKPAPAVCTRDCPSIVAYPFRTDNPFPYSRHLPEYVQRNRDYRASMKKTPTRGSRPRVSVVLPSYNHRSFLPKAIESILEQSYRDFELIIVNDGSTDGTKGYLDGLTDPRIRVIHQENQRLPGALNTGFEAARGELLTWTSADNWAAPMYLEAQVKALDAHPEAGFSVSAFAWIDDQDRITGVHRDQDLSYPSFLCSNPGLASFMYRRSCQDAVGLYDPQLEGAEDWDMWLRIRERFEPVYVPEVLYYYRLHADSMTARMPEKVHRAASQAFLNALERQGNDLDLDRLYPAIGRCSNRALAETQAAFDFGTRLLRSTLGTPEQVRVAALFLEAALERSNDPTVAHNLGVAYLRLALRENLDALLRRFPDEQLAGDDPRSLPLYTLLPDTELLARATKRVYSFTEAPAASLPQELFASKATLRRHLKASPDDEEAWRKYDELVLKIGARHDRPLVSVVVPTFNRPKLLARTLSSLLEQTYQNLEILVVNDAGEDVSGVVERLNAPNIRVIVHPENKGLAASRNTGIRAARGKYVAYLDDDDLFYPEHVETLVECLENSEHRVAYTDAYRAHQREENGELVTFLRDIPYSFDFDYDRILLDNFVPVLCFMHEKACLDEVGLFDETLPVLEDWDLWIRLSRKYRLHHLKKVTCEFSWRTDGSTMTSSRRSDFLNAREVIYNKSLRVLSGGAIAARVEQNLRQTIEQKKQVERAPVASIIMLTLNQLQYTRTCVESLFRHTGDFELILVDNGSTDGTIEYLKDLAAHRSNVKLVLNASNRGFAGGCNQGFLLAKGQYLVLLNNDTVVTEGWLDDLIQAAPPGVGIVGPRSNHVTGPQLVRSVPYDPSTLEGFPDFAAEWRRVHAGEVHSVRRVIGFCMLIRRAVVEQIGGLDPSFGTGNLEDDDFCARALLAGFRIHIAGGVFIHHFGNATFLGEKIDYRQSIEHNWAIFRNKWKIPQERTTEEAYGLEDILRLSFDPWSHTIPLFFPGEKAELPDRRGFNIVAAGDVELVKQAASAYLEAFEPEDDVAFHVLAGNQLEATKAGVLEVIRGMGLDPERIPDLSILDAPSSPFGYPAFLRTADLVIGPPHLAYGAEEQGIPALQKPDPAQLRRARKGERLLPPMSIERRKNAFFHHPDWSGEQWKEVLLSFARRFSSEDDVTLVFWLDPSQGLSLSDAEGKLLEALVEAGIPEEKTPDLLLVPDALDSDGLKALYLAIDTVIPRSEGDPVAVSLGKPIQGEPDAW